MKRTIAIVVSVAAFMLPSCSSESDTNSQAPTESASAQDTTSAAGPNEASLRVRLNEFYELARARDYSAMYVFSSPRCQAKTSEDEYIGLLERAWADRDFSGDPEFLISVQGQVATVVTKSADGKGPMQPNTWTFSDGTWQFDNC
jgi:hypothetical protein